MKKNTKDTYRSHASYDSSWDSIVKDINEKQNTPSFLQASDIIDLEEWEKEEDRKEEELRKDAANVTKSSSDANKSAPSGNKNENKPPRVPSLDEEPAKKSHGFAIFLLIWSLLLITGIGVGLKYVWDVLADYEAGIPENFMDTYLESFGNSELDRLLDGYPVEINAYDTYDTVKQMFHQVVDQQTISYEKRRDEYTSAAPVYELSAGENAFAKIYLCQMGTNAHGFSIWGIDHVDFNGYVLETHDYSIHVPGGAKVLVGGEAIDPSYLTGTEEVEYTKYIQEYVKTVPTYDCYTITGLLSDPEVTVEGDNYVETELEGYNLSYDYGTDEALKTSVTERIQGLTHSYAIYLVNKGTLSVASNSSIGHAKKIIANLPSPWAYLWNEEYTYEFSEEYIDHFVKYNDECFRADAHYVLTVTWRGGSISYSTKIAGMYVYSEGNWYLADFEIFDEEPKTTGDAEEKTKASEPATTKTEATP